MKRTVFVGSMALALLVTFTLQGADKADKADKAAQGKKKRKGVQINCPVSGKKINRKAFVEHNGGKVYFCCPNCPAAFKKSTEKFAAKANHQLVATRQFRQAKCPIRFTKLNQKTRIQVGGARVAFCCNNCKGRAQKAEDKIALIFSDAAFKKAFVKAKTRKKQAK